MSKLEIRIRATSFGVLNGSKDFVSKMIVMKDTPKIAKDTRPLSTPFDFEFLALYMR